MANYWTWFQGQLGIERRGQATNAEWVNGRLVQVPVGLDQFDSVHLLVAKNAASEPVIDMATCEIDADQSTITDGMNKGWFTYTTDADAAAVIPGRYLLSIVGVIGSTRHYFPLNKRRERSYGELIIHPALD